MHPDLPVSKISEFREIQTARDRLKKASGNLLTNFYLNESVVNSLAEHGLLLRHAAAGCDLIFRQHMDFLYLYFISDSDESLREALRGLDRTIRAPLVADIPGRAGSLGPAVEVLEAAGFGHHETLERMNRTGKFTSSGEPEQREILYGSERDAEPILVFFLESLDRFSEQIPTMEEIVLALKKNELLVARQGEEIAGVLHYEQSGNMSHLRKWHVHEKYRGRKTGSRLMKDYFYLCRDSTRHVLWVKAGNEDSINKYKHYGYGFDGMIDKIFVKVPTLPNQ